VSIFSHFAKAMVDQQRGKIHVYPNGYEFGDKGATNGQGVFLKAIPDADGRMVSLTLGLRTAGNCPVAPGTYPKIKTRYSVPMKVCRLCQHHLSRRPGQPYPCCGVLRQLALNGPSPAEQVQQVIDKAAENVAAVMGNRPAPGADGEAVP
jgi:hypothetical protein